MPQSPLKLLCVGTGRDGTTSLWKLIQQIYDQAGAGQAAHEYCAREFHEAFSRYKETEDPAFLRKMEAMVQQCPYDCIVGNGYASALPIFSKVCGADNILLIHIQRTDVKACVTSLAENAERFPGSYRYYVPSLEHQSKRMTAFHFDECTQSDWEDWPLQRKLTWYYDKTHSLIAENRSLFSGYLHIRTEDLDSDETRQKLAAFVTGNTGAKAPPAIHLNRHIGGFEQFPRETMEKMQWLLGLCDWRRLAREETYSVEYFTEALLQQLYHRLAEASASDDPEARRQLAADVERAITSVWTGYQRIDELRGREAIRDFVHPEAGVQTLLRPLQEALESARETAASQAMAALQADFARDVAALKAEFAREVAAQQADLATMQETLSWRVTAPLRSVRRRFNIGAE